MSKSLSLPIRAPSFGALLCFYVGKNFGEQGAILEASSWTALSAPLETSPPVGGSAAKPWRVRGGREERVSKSPLNISKN